MADDDYTFARNRPPYRKRPLSDAKIEEARRLDDVKSALKSSYGQPFVGAYRKGGRVKRTGLAKVHKGEVIVPKGKAAMALEHHFPDKRERKM